MNNDYSENDVSNESKEKQNILSIDVDKIDSNIELNNTNIEIDNNIEIIPEKKKRGRKPKIKEDIPECENLENNNGEKVLKKRGRKPKIKTGEEVEKIPKKRGRKPKEKIFP